MNKKEKFINGGCSKRKKIINGTVRQIIRQPRFKKIPGLLVYRSEDYAFAG